jgi:hypothetical protein
VEDSSQGSGDRNRDRIHLALERAPSRGKRQLTYASRSCAAARRSDRVIVSS